MVIFHPREFTVTYFEERCKQLQLCYFSRSTGQSFIFFLTPLNLNTFTLSVIYRTQLSLISSLFIIPQLKLSGAHRIGATTYTLLQFISSNNLHNSKISILEENQVVLSLIDAYDSLFECSQVRKPPLKFNLH